MEDTYEQEETYSDDSATYQDGSPEEDSSSEVETPETPDEAVQDDLVAAAPTETPTVETKPATGTTTAPPAGSPYAQVGDYFTAEERSTLQGWLSDEIIDTLAVAQRRNVEGRVAAELQAYEQQQDFAQEIGVPQQYMRDVRAYANKVPENIRGQKAGAEAAILLAMHDRANQPGGKSLVDQMQDFVQAARPAPVAAAVAEKKPSAPVERLPAAAVTTKSSASGVTARNGATQRSTDPLDKLFPFAPGRRN